MSEREGLVRVNERVGHYGTFGTCIYIIPLLIVRQDTDPISKQQTRRISKQETHPIDSGSMIVGAMCLSGVCGVCLQIAGH